MNDHRRRTMLILLAVTVVLFVGDTLYSSFVAEPIDKNQAQVAAISKKIEDASTQLRRTKQWIDQLDAIEHRSLPSNVQSARTLYQNWLNEITEEVALANRHIDSGTPIGRDGYQVLPFNVRGVAGLGSIVRLLYRFYHAPHLHQIRSVSLSPLAGGNQLDVSLTIHAVVINGTSRANEMASGSGDSLAYSSTSDYDLIARRNIFSTTGGEADLAHTYLSAVIKVNGKPQAWFTHRQTGQVSRVLLGESVNVGWLSAEVLEIDTAVVLLNIAGNAHRMQLDDTLAEAARSTPVLRDLVAQDHAAVRQ